MNNQTPSTNASTPRTPPEFSPFSNSTALSEPTSDEQPDLGAFTTVLRAWNHFQPQLRIPAYHHSSSSSSITYGRRSDTGTDHTYGLSEFTDARTYGPHFQTASSGSIYTRQLPDDSNNLHPELIARDTSVSEQSSSCVEGDYSNPVYLLSSSPPSPDRVSTSTSFNFDRSTLAPTRSSAREPDIEELESTVWNQPRIASYLESELGAGSRGLSAESAGPFVEDEREEEESCPSVLSPDSEGSRTIEIASELDGGETRVDSVTLEADDSAEQVQEVPFVSASFNRDMNSAESSSISRDDIDINLDIQDDDQAVTPREVSVISKGSQMESARSYNEDIDPTSSERDFISYANELTTPSSLSTRARIVQSISLSCSQSSPYSHADSRLSNSAGGSSGFRYPNTASSLSLISYQLPNESEMSPLDMPRLHIEHGTLSPGSGISPSLEVLSEPERDAYVENLNVSSPISSFDVSPDPVVDIDPSPVPSNSPRHALVSHSFQEEPNKSPIAPVSGLIGIPQDRTDPLLSSSLDLFDQVENQISSQLSNLLNEEPFFIDPTTFRPIHHVGGHFREHQLPQYETPVYLHELSGTAPTNESQPSLGYLDEALSFIAAERAKWMVQRESGSGIGDSKWKHVIEPRRKRRRKRLPKSAPSTLASTTPLGSATPVANSGLQTTTTDGDNDNDDDDDDDPSKDDTPRKQLEEGYLSLSGHLGQSKKGRLQREKGKVRGKNAELPQEGLDEDTPRPKRERLQELARKLQEVFPKDRSKLEIIINQLGNVTERSDSKRRHTNANNCKDSFETDENDLDPRGPPPTRDDTLIHVFIDHSNILIGLLSHLKRYPPSRVKEAKSNARSLTSASGDDVPVRNLASHNHSSPLLCVEETTDGHFPLIPLPSFATASAKDASNRERAQRENMKIKKSNSDGDEKIERGINATLHRKSKKPVRHLWHAALTLILERGRPINRRVLVTSSPLYQPMDGIERLGYEVRVYLRVPDLGDGMDRERGGSRHNKSNSASGNNFNATPVGMAGNSSQLGHKRKFSNSSNENHISATASIATDSDLHPFYTATDLNNNINTNAAVVGRGTIGARGTTRIKYREQGVDELLQLKLHQALAATDEVPDGSTIILATGDGNVGQFNEDGFLGPVRTALRRGWKVELYAWEDGLSRSWRREFGEDSEWGRNGMFRIIGMEQFANRLVEAVAW